MVEPDPIPLPITGELDLHTFRPQDLGALIPAYLEECLSRKIQSIRIIHGKGTGTLQTTVHVLLSRHPRVKHFSLCDENSGGWGATRVFLE